MRTSWFLTVQNWYLLAWSCGVFGEEETQSFGKVYWSNVCMWWLEQKRYLAYGSLHTRRRTTENRQVELKTRVGCFLYDYVMCNLDVAIFSTMKKVGTTVCLRDVEWHFKKTYNIWCTCVMSAAEEEAWGLNQAIDWLIPLHLNWVTL